MTEILFYHLERQTLEGVLPSLLEKCVERGWRVAVQTISPERVQHFDEYLWSYSENSFLPHAGEAEPNLGDEPIVVTCHAVEPNAARVKFLVDNAPFPADVAPYDRIVLLFNGNDDAALNAARATWKDIKGRGLQATYWQQNEAGRWEKKA